MCGAHSHASGEVRLQGRKGRKCGGDVWILFLMGRGVNTAQGARGADLRAVTSNRPHVAAVWLWSVSVRLPTRSTV